MDYQRFLALSSLGTIKDNQMKTTDLEEIIELAEHIIVLRGGRTSGNWGHAGRPGKRGGSKRGAGFKAIGVRKPKGRGEVKRKAKEAKEKVTVNTNTIFENLPKPFKSSPNNFYKALGMARAGDLKSFGGKKLTLTQAQALSSKFEKEFSGKTSQGQKSQGQTKQQIFSKSAQAKSDKKPKSAKTTPGKPQAGDLKNTATAMARDEALNDYKDFHQNATPAENTAMTRYQGNGYKVMNSHLRFGNDIGDADLENIKQLDMAIDKAPRLSKDSTLYRGMAFAAYASQLGDDPSKWTGQVFEDKGYMSTSRDSSQSFPGVFAEVRSPKGTKTVYFGNLPNGPHNSEEEFLMARGTKFAVTGVELGGPSGNWITKVYTEIVDQT